MHLLYLCHLFTPEGGQLLLLRRHGRHLLQHVLRQIAGLQLRRESATVSVGSDWSTVG
jgi:hypothetical protein